MISRDIETARLVLHCLSDHDVNNTYLAWLQDPRVNEFLETRFTESSIHSLRNYVESMRNSEDSYLFGIFSKSTREHLGNIKIGPISQHHGSAAVGIVIGNRDAWGKGFASESITALSEWAFEEIGLDKLTAGSYVRNSGSIRAFERSGFQIEGIQRSQVALRDGGRDDVAILGMPRNVNGESRT